MADPKILLEERLSFLPKTLQKGESILSVLQGILLIKNTAYQNFYGNLATDNKVIAVSIKCMCYGSANPFCYGV